MTVRTNTPGQNTSRGWKEDINSGRQRAELKISHSALYS